MTLVHGSIWESAEQRSSFMGDEITVGVLVYMSPNTLISYGIPS